MQQKHDLKIFGHRGAAGLELENTLASIQKAIALGVDFIEIDVWKTTDNEIVVFHDFSLERLTESTGFIAEKSWSELQEIPLKNGSRIPTLQEVVSLIKPHAIPLVVEVKDEKAMEKTLQLLQEKLPGEAFLIGSFYHQPIRDLKRKHPELQTAIMFECVPANLEAYLQEVNPDFVVASVETFNQSMVETVRNQNRKLVFYTVNTEAEFARAMQAGPYGIVTNFPDRFLHRSTPEINQPYE